MYEVASSFAVSRVLVTPLVNGHVPLPTDDELAEARRKKLAADAAKSKLSTPEDRARQAADSLRRAETMIGNSAERFQLLQDGMAAAAEGGKVDLAWTMAESFALWFGADPIDKVADALDKAKKTRMTPPLCRVVAEDTAWLIDVAVAQGNLAGAERLYSLAKEFAQRASDARPNGRLRPPPPTRVPQAVQ